MKSEAAEFLSFPIVGPATAYFKLPVDDPERILKSIQGDDRLFVEAEIAIARCDFGRAKTLCDRLTGNKRYFFISVRIAIIAAIGLGDIALFDSIRAQIAAYRTSLAAGSVEHYLVDITEAWIRQWLWLPSGYPEWICRFDFADVPKEWHRPAAYIGVVQRMNAGMFESAYAAAALMMSGFVESEDVSARYFTAERAYLRMARAIACRETGRAEEMRKWIGEVARELAPHGFIMPFLLFMHGDHKSPVEQILSEVAPGEVARFKKVKSAYFINLIHVRNHMTGETITDALTFREFYLAMLLKRGFAYKDLASRFDLSVGRIKNIVLGLYEKLGIHTRNELNSLVW